MKKRNQKLMLLGGLLIACSAFGQVLTVGDNLNSVSTAVQTTKTSPSFAFCNGELVNYTMSTPVSGNFTHVSASGNPSLINGVIFPASTGSNSTTAVQINWVFTEDIHNFRVHIHDLDGQNNAESITQILPSYTSVTSTIGIIQAVVGGTTVNGNGDNTSGWINWGTPIAAGTTIKMTYNRPGKGYGLIIDSIEFSCTEVLPPGCNCRAIVDDKLFGSTEQNGIQNTSLIIDSQGELVSSLTIDLPFYTSNVDHNCLQCDGSAQESFGTIINASTIAGIFGVLYDPLGQGFSRKLVYDFPTPIALNQAVDLELQFPPVLELSCCENSVQFCLDVTLKKEDCTSCEYTICNIPSDVKSNDKVKSVKTFANGIFEESPKSNFTNEIKGLVISPNPASSYIDVDVTNENFLGQEVLISNSLGEVITTVKLLNKNVRLNTENFAPGIYLINILSQENGDTLKLIIE